MPHSNHYVIMLYVDALPQMLCSACAQEEGIFLSTNPRVEHEKQAQRNTGDSSYTGEKTETCEHLKTQGEDHIVSSPRNRAVACRENRQTAPFRQ